MSIPLSTIPRGPHFVGREREATILRQTLLSTLSGHGALALIAGEAGIGKTTLVEHLAQEADRHEMLVLVGQCYELETTPPYGPWKEMARSFPVRGDLPPPPYLSERMVPESVAGPEELRAVLCRHFVTMADHTPVMVIVEDAHWADQSSLDFLRYLARHVANHSILILVTYRDAELQAGHPLSRLLPHLVRESRPARIALRPLDQQAVECLVQERYGLTSDDTARLVDQLTRTAEGNPFFIGELLSAMEQDQILHQTADGWGLGDLAVASVPLLLRQVVENRLEQASQQTREYLQVAAVIGLEVPIDLWRHAVLQSSEAMADTIEEALAVRALIDARTTATLRFRHALICQALYEGLPLPRRNAWHRRIGEVLAARPRCDPEGPAYHFWRASDQRAIPWLIQAGDRAQAVYAPAAAVDHYTKAFDLADSFSIDISAAAWLARGRAQATIGRFDAALKDFTTALAAAQEADDNLTEWQTLMCLGKLWNARDYSRVSESFQRANGLAQELGDNSLLAHSLTGIGNWHVNVGHAVQAIFHHQRALAVFEELGDQRAIAETANNLALDNLIRGDMLQAAKHAKRAMTVAEMLNEEVFSVAATMGLIGSSGIYEFATEIPAMISTVDVRQAGERGIALARDMSWPAEAAFVRTALASHLGMRGDYGTALALAEQAYAIAREIDHREWMSLSAVVLGEIMLDLQAWSEAERHLTTALEHAANVNAFVHLHIAGGSLARAIVATGDIQQASAVLEPVLCDITATETSVERACWRARAEVALAAGDPETALRIADRLIATTINGTVEQIPPSLGCLRAAALVALGRLEDGEATLNAAERTAQRCGFRCDLWRIHKIRSEIYGLQHRMEEGDRAREAQRLLLAELAATIPDRNLREQFLNRATPPAGAVSPATAAGLSARELEVLRLAARGMTNEQIADELYIGSRTVKGHLQSIYTKLGVNSRTAATAFAFEHQLV